jgi:hypothetical protein
MKERVLSRWKRFPKLTRRIKLITIEYDYRDVITPLVHYIEKVNNEEFPDQLTTVVIPTFIPSNTVERLLHNQTAAQLRWSLSNYKDIVLIEVPIHINSKV